MPRKARRGKRRIDPITEARAWGMVFATGHDFFCEATAFTGLPEPVHVPPETRPEARRAWLAAAEDAWRRVGAFWAAHCNDPTKRPLADCWAYKQFGGPSSLCQ